MPTSSSGLFPFSAPSIFYRKSPGDEDVVPFVFFASPPVIEMWRIETESSSYHPTPVFSYDPLTQTSERANQTKYGFGVYLKHVPTLFVLCLMRSLLIYKKGQRRHGWQLYDPWESWETSCHVQLSNTLPRPTPLSPSLEASEQRMWTGN